MKILFFGDLQLEKGSDLGYGQVGDGSRFHDQEQTLDAILVLAANEGVDFVCCLGDVFEYPTPSPWAILAFQRFMGQLVSAVIVRGNHDVKGASLPTILDVFGDRAVVSNTPQLIHHQGVVFATLPWASLKTLAATSEASGSTLRAEAAETLVSTAQLLRLQCGEQYPEATPILLGHWAVSGATLPSGGSVEEMLAEPIIPWHDLDDLGFALCVFGHIHQPQQIAPDLAATPIIYVGSPMPCDFGEAASPHGVWIFDTDKRELRFCELKSRPLVTLEPKLVEVAGDMAFAAPPGDVRDALVRVRYRVTPEEARKVRPEKIIADLRANGAHKVFLRGETIQPGPRARVDADMDAVGPQEALEMWLRANNDTDMPAARREAIRERHQEYLEAVR